jgi:hypothetical protein
MKKKLLVGLLSALLVLAPTGYFGKKYFDENYVLLNSQQVGELMMAIQADMMKSYQFGFQEGKTACENTL